jgi:peptidoglycan/LPS O-acetylase OafA/YrhL
MTASSVSFPAAVLMGVFGMSWGIYMAMTHDHTTMPAHAHLNLLGWVSLFLIGVFYRLHPALDRSRAALIQVGIWIVATAVMVGGITLIMNESPIGEPVAAVSSIVILADMLFFGWLVIGNRQPERGSADIPVAAE